MPKPAPLAAGVLLKKGLAAPMIDSQGRDGPSPTWSQAAAPTASHISTLAAAPLASTQAVAPPAPHFPTLAAAPAAAPEAPAAKTRTADLEPLGFKVPPQFNQEFRRFAFENGYKLNELLFAAFESFKKARIRESANS
jgi:hypothetical protein